VELDSNLEGNNSISQGEVLSKELMIRRLFPIWENGNYKDMTGGGKKKQAKERKFSPQFINEPGYVNVFSWNTIKRHDKDRRDIKGVQLNLVQLINAKNV
jgi:hypothetical protein